MSTPDQAFDKSQQQLEIISPENVMERLLEIGPSPLPVLSLYLDARAGAQGRRNFLPFVRKQLHGHVITYESHAPERESIEADTVRILSYLEDIKPETSGIAIFSCSGIDLFDAAEFRAPFQRNQLFVDDLPHLYPLARLSDQYRRYAVVLADTNRAEVFVFAALRARERQEIQNVKTKQANVGGWTQSRYQRHVENYHLHHAKEVIDVLERTVRDDGIESVILAGDEETVIPILRQQMSKELSNKVIDVLSLGIDTPEHELLAKSLDALRRHDSFSDMEKVEHLLAEYRRDGLAVAGVPETLAALSNGQVEELFITESTASLAYDRSEVRKVLELYDGADESLAGLDADAIGEELIRRSRQISSAKITFVEDGKRLEPVGGVGALLRYRISPESAAPYEQSGVVPKSEALIEK